jgi:hypothetical protein
VVTVTVIVAATITTVMAMLMVTMPCVYQLQK